MPYGAARMEGAGLYGSMVCQWELGDWTGGLRSVASRCVGKAPSKSNPSKQPSSTIEVALGLARRGRDDWWGRSRRWRIGCWAGDGARLSKEGDGREGDEMGPTGGDIHCDCARDWWQPADRLLVAIPHE